jgi:2Fe-2S ferredoxin
MSTLTVTFIDVAGTAHRIETAETGQSLMQLATANNIAGIYGDCGGGCSCATCHVYVAAQWLAVVGPPNELESEMLEMAADIRRDNSRLCCQIKLGPELHGLEVTVAPDALP